MVHGPGAGTDVAIPYRIYNDEVPGDEQHALTPTQRIMLSCLYTRHHDGFVRRHLEKIVRLPLPWVAPYVVALTGEYVLEILELIRRELVELDQPGTTVHRVYG
jgi:hypothetical protein